MPIQIKVADNYVSSGSAFFKSGGAWIKAKEGYVKVEGTWRKFFVSEFKDFFERTNASTLGTSPTGQAWTVGRGTWNIVDGKAQIATAKSTYPIALVDVGLTDFELQANEMVPGVGVIVRADSSTTWWGLVGWNNQTAYSYSFCPQALVNQGYCIVDNICQQTYCPGGYVQGSREVGGGCKTYGPDTLVGVGCTSTYVEGTPSCVTVTTPGEPKCVEKCVKTCTSTRCRPGPTTCYNYPKWGRVCSPGEDICTQTSYCCDKDTVCTPTTVTERVCTPTPGRWVDAGCITYITQAGECLEYNPSTTIYFATCPTGEATQNVVCGYPNCAQTGSRQVCPVAEQTATGYNYDYKLYLVKSINGTITVEQQFDIGENFKALRVLGVGPNMAINVYRDNAYADQIKVLSYSSFISPAGSNFGIFGYPSNYQEGTTIGSIQVKQPGA